MEFITELYHRNPILFVFGCLNFLGGLITVLLIFTSDVQYLGISAWLKPAKFFISSWIFVWSMAWLLAYINRPTVVNIYTWTVLVVMSFELIYITWKAAQGEMSHFNISSSFNGFMFSMMGLMISIMTLYTGYIGYLFFTSDVVTLPESYLWGIRLGIICFVIFAFEGGLMGSRLAHTVGALDGTPGLPFLNWSMTHGDLRIAHFVGMHALQILPLVGYYVFSQPKGTILIGLIYFVLALVVLVQALQGIPLIKSI